MTSTGPIWRAHTGLFPGFIEALYGAEIAVDLQLEVRGRAMQLSVV